MSAIVTAAEKVFEILDEPVSIPGAARPVTLARVEGDVEFRDTAFSYGRERVLEDIGFHADAGEVIALVISGTIADNVRCVRPGASDEEVIAAARAGIPTEGEESRPVCPLADKAGGRIVAGHRFTYPMAGIGCKPRVDEAPEGRLHAGRSRWARPRAGRAARATLRCGTTPAR